MSGPGPVPPRSAASAASATGAAGSEIPKGYVVINSQWYKVTYESGGTSTDLTTGTGGDWKATQQKITDLINSYGDSLTGALNRGETLKSLSAAGIQTTTSDSTSTVKEYQAGDANDSSTFATKFTDTIKAVKTYVRAAGLGVSTPAAGGAASRSLIFIPVDAPGDAATPSGGAAGAAQRPAAGEGAATPADASTAAGAQQVPTATGEDASTAAGAGAPRPPAGEGAATPADASTAAGAAPAAAPRPAASSTLGGVVGGPIPAAVGSPTPPGAQQAPPAATAAAGGTPPGAAASRPAVASAATPPGVVAGGTPPAAPMQAAGGAAGAAATAAAAGAAPRPAVASAATPPGVVAGGTPPAAPRAVAPVGTPEAADGDAANLTAAQTGAASGAAQRPAAASAATPAAARKAPAAPRPAASSTLGRAAGVPIPPPAAAAGLKLTRGKKKELLNKKRAPGRGQLSTGAVKARARLKNKLPTQPAKKSTEAVSLTDSINKLPDGQETYNQISAAAELKGKKRKAAIANIIKEHFTPKTTEPKESQDAQVQSWASTLDTLAADTTISKNIKVVLTEISVAILSTTFR